ncbi:T9SS type A sorting domain-containing protein [Fluviicola sp.]|uniref:T9SS type A sorting domain-containing protein n=1 Tax=Fluviicola sp. TaxID=1917219 RepID=UPI003D2D0B9F
MHVRLEDSFIRKLRVYDIHGIQVMEQESFSKELIIPISELTEGLYFLSLDTDKGQISSRFVKI